MTLSVFTSASSVSAVSTTALGVTLAWPRDVILLDADTQTAFLAGYLQGSSTEHSLLSVIAAARQEQPLREAIRDHAIALPDDQPDGPRRLFVPGLPSPAAARLLFDLWVDLAAAITELGDAGIDVIVDLGRLNGFGIHRALLQHADHVLMMVTPTLRGVVAAQPAAKAIHQEASNLGRGYIAKSVTVRREANLGNIARVRTGEAEDLRTQERYYGDREVHAHLELPVIGRVVRDPRWASWLSEGGKRPAKFAQSGYWHSLHTLAVKLAHTQHADPKEEVIDA